MFAKTFQSGSTPIEVISASGKEPNPKLLKCNQVTKDYERSIKGYIYNIERTSPHTFLNCPANLKDSLGIYQQYLVLQLFPFPAKHVHLEVIIMDTKSQRRRFLLSTSFQKAEANELHCQIPWSIENRGIWNSIVIDLKTLASRCFKGAVYSVLESFTLRPCCHLRKVFTVPMIDFSAPSLFPHNLCFPIGVDSSVCVIDDVIRNTSHVIGIPATQVAVGKRAIGEVQASVGSAVSDQRTTLIRGTTKIRKPAKSDKCTAISVLDARLPAEICPADAFDGLCNAVEFAAGNEAENVSPIETSVVKETIGHTAVGFTAEYNDEDISDTEVNTIGTNLGDIYNTDASMRVSNQIVLQKRFDEEIMASEDFQGNIAVEGDYSALELRDEAEIAGVFNNRSSVMRKASDDKDCVALERESPGADNDFTLPRELSFVQHATVDRHLMASHHVTDMNGEFMKGQVVNGDDEHVSSLRSADSLLPGGDSAFEKSILPRSPLTRIEGMFDCDIGVHRSRKISERRIVNLEDADDISGRFLLLKKKRESLLMLLREEVNKYESEYHEVVALL